MDSTYHESAYKIPFGTEATITSAPADWSHHGVTRMKSPEGEKEGLANSCYLNANEQQPQAEETTETVAAPANESV